MRLSPTVNVRWVEYKTDEKWNRQPLHPMGLKGMQGTPSCPVLYILLKWADT